MFGLEQNKDKVEPFLYELEKEILDPEKGKKLEEYVEKQIAEIKNELRAGSAKDQFDQLGVLLQGYLCLTQVIKNIKALHKK